MISAEAPILFAKAAEIFISELSLRAWIHTEDNKRRTLQRNDIAMAITKYDQFDFLIDIVPRDELKPAKRQEEVVRQPPNVMAPEQVQYYFHLSQLQSNAAAAAGTTNSSATPVQATANTPQITHLPPGAHVIQQNGQFIIATPQQLSGLQSAGTTPAQTANGAVQPQIVQLAQPPPQAQQNTSTTPASAEGTQSAVQQSTSNVVQQQSTELSTSQAQSNTTQVQLSSGGQVHYVRIPTSALQQQGATGVSQLILQQHLQQQQQQQQQQQSQQTTQESSQQTQSSNQQQQQQTSSNGVEPSIPSYANSSGGVYVVAPQNTQQQSTQNNSGVNNESS